jgi:hypothetical protein
VKNPQVSQVVVTAFITLDGLIKEPSFNLAYWIKAIPNYVVSLTLQKATG